MKLEQNLMTPLALRTRIEHNAPNEKNASEDVRQITTEASELPAGLLDALAGQRCKQ